MTPLITSAEQTTKRSIRSVPSWLYRLRDSDLWWSFTHHPSTLR